MDVKSVAERVAKGLVGDLQVEKVSLALADACWSQMKRTAGDRKRKADYGDVTVYLNVFEFFSAKDADRDVVVRLENAVHGAAMKHFLPFRESVKRALKTDSGLVKFMSVNGVSFK